MYFYEINHTEEQTDEYSLTKYILLIFYWIRIISYFKYKFITSNRNSHLINLCACFISCCLCNEIYERIELTTSKDYIR